jgi:hypothetical protein
MKKIRDRKDRIREYASHAAHLETMVDFAGDSELFTESERVQLGRDLRACRRAIISELSDDELRALKARNLDPKDALEIIKDETVLPDDLGKALAAAYTAQVAERSYFTVDKAYTVPLVPGTIGELAAHDRAGSIRKLELPKSEAAPMATLADVAENHRHRT